MVKFYPISDTKELLSKCIKYRDVTLLYQYTKVLYHGIWVWYVFCENKVIYKNKMKTIPKNTNMEKR